LITGERITKRLGGRGGRAVSERKQDYRDCAERVAREILGEPTPRLSNDKELRWGNHGSLALNVERGLFFDHEHDEGGGVRWLLRHRLGLDEAAINRWLQDRRYITIDDPQPNGGRRPNQRKIVATYDYVDTTGALLFQVVRYEPKTFRQRRPNGADWSWSVKGERQVPYRLPALAEAIGNQRPVTVVEGEKDVDRLAQWNVVATTNAGGAGKWRPELNQHFRGADVILIPDADEAGHRHVHLVGAALAGVAQRIRVLMLPGLPPKGDVSDWIEAGGTADRFWELVEAAPDWVAPTVEADADETSAAKAATADAEQCLIDELARLDQTEYDRRRTDAAHELGVRRSTLDDARQHRRAEIDAERGPPPLRGDWIVQPWAEPVDGDALLLAIVRRIRRHVVLSNDQAIAVALWVLMTWAHQEAAVHSPILLATSAEANSGKSTLAKLIGFIVPRGMNCVGITEAPLYRGIELWEPTVIVDEADSILIDNEPLRTVINSGWTRGDGVPRCISDSYIPHLFPTFCPKAIAMKGLRLPDTTLSRCIIIELKRKKPSETAEHFKHIDDAGLCDLRRQAMRWTMDHVKALKTAEPVMPAAFENRLGDNWRLMLAIADLAGGQWPEHARQAAVVVAKVLDSGDTSVGIRLLADLKAILEERGVDRIFSEELAEALRAMEDRPWSDWKGKPITKTAIARLLKPFKDQTSDSKTIRVGNATLKGYSRQDFQDAFERYL
jgi:Protein of unknown function (DUF3631)